MGVLGGDANAGSAIGTSVKESGHFSAMEWRTVVQSYSMSTSAPPDVLEMRHRA